VCAAAGALGAREFAAFLKDLKRGFAVLGENSASLRNTPQLLAAKPDVCAKTSPKTSGGVTGTARAKHREKHDVKWRQRSG
jgi:hypothetical protein